MPSPPPTDRIAVDEALQVLGISNFLLGIHDAAFPVHAQEDLGCGTAYSEGAAEFLRFIRELGFTGIQIGPQGITSPDNPSPYDGTLFSRSPLLLAPLALTRSPWKLLESEQVTRVTRQSPPGRTRVHRDFAEQACRGILAAAHRNHRRMLDRGPDAENATLREAWIAFRKRNATWLERDALYEVLRKRYRGKGWMEWDGALEARLDRCLFSPTPEDERAARMRRRFLLERHAEVIDEFYFAQFLLAEEHQGLQRRCRRLGLALFGDCQIGMSDRDAWFAQDFLLPDYLLGAPPSRTNPAGQPWNYPVPDPSRYFLDDPEGGRQPGPVIRFFMARIERLFADFDGLRIDHPHGLICPWVYRSGQDNPHRAVQQGARLFASPSVEDHPELARFAIARPDQIDSRAARHDDAWVTDLDANQVHRYGILFDQIVAAARREGTPRRIACEILSTQPYPLKRVMARYGQGRFRVTQKADLSDARDVYRSENARAEDWVMLGNHDTPTIWKRAEDWSRTGTARRQALYLAERLRVPEKDRAAWAERVAADPGLLVQAKFADLFVGPAQNVMVYFTDLFGMQLPYNRPGNVSGANWSLRLDPDYRNLYRSLSERRRALKIPSALAMAIRARGEKFAADHRDLIARLESAAG